MLKTTSLFKALFWLRRKMPRRYWRELTLHGRLSSCFLADGDWPFFLWQRGLQVKLGFEIFFRMPNGTLWKYTKRWCLIESCSVWFAVSFGPARTGGFHDAWGSSPTWSQFTPCTTTWGSNWHSARNFCLFSYLFSRLLCQKISDACRTHWMWMSR